MPSRFFNFVCALLLVLWLVGCGRPEPESGVPGAPAGTHGTAQRLGDEVVVAGQLFHTGTRVVLWYDAGGMNGYGPAPKAKKGEQPIPGFQMGRRRKDPPPGSPTTQPIELESPTLDTLRELVDQFVLHYDGSGVSSRCFDTLQRRGLSVHFMLDLDGTIYQAIDLQERAFHATTSNSRSVGVEIANLGAFPVAAPAPALSQWYVDDGWNGLRITVPSRPEYPAPVWRDPDFVPRPARPSLVTGVVQRETLKQYDFTPEQYEALAHLTATLSHIFPKIRCDFPRDASGRLVTEKLPDDQLARFNGVIGHFHIQANKTDPGPAMQWDRLIAGARKWRGR